MVYTACNISCSLLLEYVSMCGDSSLKDTSSTMTILILTILGALVAQWVKRWPTDLAD